MSQLSEMSSGDILRLGISELLSQDTLLDLYEIEEASERARIKALMIACAKKNGIEKEFKSVLSAYDNEEERLNSDYSSKQRYTTDFSFQEYELDCGHWLANDLGVRYEKANGETVYASRIPLIPSALLENINTGTEKVRIDFFKNGQKSLICERSVTASTSNIIKLADKGIEVNSENAKHLVRYISDCITLNLDTLPCYKAVSQLGWNSEGFTPYADGIVFDGEEQNGHLFRSVTEKGSFEKWLQLTSTLRQNRLVRLMMAASFASVLIEKVGALPFIFHLWGTTGGGKTVTLMVAASIWGNPAQGKMLKSLNMTQNALLSTAAFLNSIPFAGDELQTIKNRWEGYDQLIMRVTEGIDRGRMSYDKNNETKSWHCAFLFTGEERCTSDSSGGGAKNRVIEIEVTQSLLGEYLGNEIANTLRENHGHAGKKFIDYISSQKNLTERFNSISQSIIKSCDTTEKQASSMALVLLADELAGECIYKDEKPLTIDDVKQYVTSTKEVDIAERAHEFIINHIAQNYNRFSADNNHGEIWGAVREEEGYVLINASVLKRELSAHGYEFDAVKRKWADKKYIIKNSAGRYSHTTVAFGIKANYIKITYEPIESETEEPEEDDIPFPGDWS